MRSPLKFFVALDAKLHFGVVMRQMFMPRSMGLMATFAIHGDVTVPGIDGLLSDRVRRMLLPLMTGTADIDDG